VLRVVRAQLELPVYQEHRENRECQDHLESRENPETRVRRAVYLKEDGA